MLKWAVRPWVKLLGREKPDLHSEECFMVLLFPFIIHPVLLILGEKIISNKLIVTGKVKIKDGKTIPKNPPFQPSLRVWRTKARKKNYNWDKHSHT